MGKAHTSSQAASRVMPCGGSAHGLALGVVGCRLDDEPRGSSEGGKRNRHLFDLLIAGNATDGSTPLRTAPAGEGCVVLRPGVKRVADVADIYAPDSRGADEYPLVCRPPV